MIHTAPLARAVSRLEESLNWCDSSLAQDSPELFEQFRTAAIKGFEFTYELAWKLQKRYLEEETGVAEIDHLSRRDLFRTAAEAGLIADATTWFVYHQARNLTAHTYNTEPAVKVMASLRPFVADVRRLLEILNQRLGNE
ncbi:MAG: HI0074 family nucleotidyltransferase substrate-binding subunit [Alphaproteobacteria bacterium]